MAFFYGFYVKYTNESAVRAIQIVIFMVKSSILEEFVIGLLRVEV
jgi:hypothetical protein